MQYPHESQVRLNEQLTTKRETVAIWGYAAAKTRCVSRKNVEVIRINTFTKENGRQTSERAQFRATFIFQLSSRLPKLMLGAASAIWIFLVL